MGFAPLLHWILGSMCCIEKISIVVAQNPTAKLSNLLFIHYYLYFGTDSGFDFESSPSADKYNVD